MHPALGFDLLLVGGVFLGFVRAFFFFFGFFGVAARAVHDLAVVLRVAILPGIALRGVGLLLFFLAFGDFERLFVGLVLPLRVERHFGIIALFLGGIGPLLSVFNLFFVLFSRFRHASVLSIRRLIEPDAPWGPILIPDAGLTYRQMVENER